MYTRLVSLSGAVVLVLIGSYMFLSGDNEKLVSDQEPRPQLKRIIAFNLSVVNTSAQVQTNVEILVSVPNRKTAVQQGGSISSNYPYISKTDSLNNHVLHFMFETIPPFGTRIINLSTQVVFMMPPQKVALQEKEFFLAKEPFIEISSKELVQFAKQFRSETSQESVKKIHAWIASAITHTAYSSKERGALYAFRKRKGDCTEFMYLFVALCRLNNIPARGVSGYITTQDKQVQANDFHDWTEVYIDGTWQLVDPFNSTYMEKQTEYVTIRVHGPDEDGFNFHRWKSENDNLQITMSR